MVKFSKNVLKLFFDRTDLTMKFDFMQSIKV